MPSQDNSDTSDVDDDDLGYYNDADFVADCDTERAGPSRKHLTGEEDEYSDPEYFDYSSLQLCEVERLLNECVEKICENVPVTPALAKVLLLNSRWDVDGLIRRYKEDCHKLLVDTHLKPPHPIPTGPRPTFCPVCCRNLSCSEFRGLNCGHSFCRCCWTEYCATQLQQGVSTGIECMEADCRLLAPEDFLASLLSARPDLRSKYQHFVFQDHVKSHPELRFCPGPGCSVVVQAKEAVPKRAVCKICHTAFCFRCGMDYHAPTDCDTIKQWLIKCADDSETANYITANTKDCPNCHACIEKNGGCNHMQCAKCKHHFCWMCLGDWKKHGSEYYECSRYKENPAVAQETVHVKARKALEKYLFYFERWENHNKSLKLEEKMLEKIKVRIEERVNRHEGTWIDWQYLFDAASLLTKSRYTLQYTYPYAYYLEDPLKKDLFEYQQAQLEKEIEELSWKVERAEHHNRGELENQMHVAETKRRTLLKYFFE